MEAFVWGLLALPVVGAVVLAGCGFLDMAEGAVRRIVRRRAGQREGGR